MKKLMLKLDFKEQNVVEVREGEHLMHALVFECIQVKALFYQHAIISCSDFT